MPAIDIISFLLGIYAPIFLIRYLLPCKVAPLLSTLLDETHQLLGRAEEISAVTAQSEYKCQLDW